MAMQSAFMTGAWAAVRENRHIVMLAAAMSFAMFLRMWPATPPNLWTGLALIAAVAAVALALYSICASLDLRGAGVLAAFMAGVSTIAAGMEAGSIGAILFPALFLPAVAAMARNIKDERRAWYLLAGALAGAACGLDWRGAACAAFLTPIYFQVFRSPAGWRANIAKPAWGFLVLILTCAVVRLGAGPDAAVSHDGYSGAGGDGFLRQIWISSMLFHPLPFWIGSAAWVYAVYSRPQRLTFLLIGCPLAYVMAQIPGAGSAAAIAAISPLFLLGASVGMMDLAGMISIRPIRYSALALLAFFMIHGALQISSFRVFPPAEGSMARWMEENIADASLLSPLSGQEAVSAPAGTHILWRAGAGWRGDWNIPPFYPSLAMGVNSALADYFPGPRVASHRAQAQIFPANRELVTTDKVFVSGPSAGHSRVQRFILAEGAPEEISLMVKNVHAGENTLSFSAGKVGKKFKLEKGGKGFFVIKTGENRGLLRNGAYLTLTVESAQDAVWMAAANDQDNGDMNSEVGQYTRGLESHVRSLTAYSLLRVTDLADKVDVRIKAFAELERRYPRLHAAITGAAPETLSWEAIAGYPDSIFAAKARIPLPLAGGLAPGAAVVSPPVALTKGEYAVELRIRSEPGIKNLLTVETRLGAVKNSTQVDAAGAEDGLVRVPFSVVSVMEYPVQISVINGGAATVALEEGSLRLDYLSDARRTVRRALDGLKRRKL